MLVSSRLSFNNSPSRRDYTGHVWRVRALTSKADRRFFFVPKGGKKARIIP